MAKELMNNEEVRTAPELKINPDQEQDFSKDQLLTKAETNEDLNDHEIKPKTLKQPAALLELPLDETPDGNKHQHLDRAMRKVSLKNELNQIQQKLTFSQRLLSKFIHQPIIREISDLSAKTFTRPAGLLGGGLLAFLGSLAYLLFAKYIGLSYNYLIFIILFIIGYLLATLIELLTSVINKQPKPKL